MAGWQCPMYNTVQFLDRSSVPLQGYKKQQYIEWRNRLQKIPRYANTAYHNTAYHNILTPTVAFSIMI